MAFLARPKRLVGLDIGSHTIKAIQVETEGTRKLITGFGYATVEPGSDEYGGRKSAIERALAAGEIKPGRVATAVSGRSVIVRFVTLPNMSDSELQEAIRREADKYIPFEADQVVLDFQQLGATKDGKEIHVLLAAVKRSLVEEHVGLLRAAGLQPVFLDYDPFALANAFELRAKSRGQQTSDEEIFALLDIGASKTLILVQGAVPLFTREINLAGNDFARAIGNRMGLVPNEVEKLRHEPAGREAEIFEAVTPVLEDLANEIALCFDYCETQYEREVKHVYLSGGGSLLPQIEDFLSQSLHRTIERWDATEGLRIAVPPHQADGIRENQALLGVAVGLAARVGGG